MSASRSRWQSSSLGCGSATASKGLKLIGWEVAEDWLNRTPSDRHHLVYNALFAIAEGTWVVAYRHEEDLVRKAVALYISDEEIVVWRRLIDYPDHFRLLYIGKRDY